MKEYIKTLLSGAMLGAALMEMINAAVRSFINKGFTLGGELLLPALIIAVGYTGWKLAESYFNGTRYKEIYRRGFTAGTKLHSYKIVIPVEEELHDKKTAG